VTGKRSTTPSAS
jgi:hypothetical protein